MDRKLATIRKIIAIEPIEGADRIELARIDGWQSVIKKGCFKVGDLAIFAEIDSIIPFAPWSEFLRDKKNPDKVIRLKTCKLKGVVSQGVIFPLDILPLIREQFCGDMLVIETPEGVSNIPVEEGVDVTEILKIEKYNPQIPAHLAGKIKSNFPTHIVPKTDSERIQNLWTEDFQTEINNLIFAARYKADGTSFTCYVKGDETGVCSRNFVLDLTDISNVYVEMALKYDLLNLIKGTGRNLSIQAEVVGPGIQKNRLGLKDKEIRVFDIYDVDRQTYFNYDDLVDFCISHNLPQVDTLTDEFIFIKGHHDLNDLLKMTEGVCYPGTKQQIEGLVFTPLTERYNNKLKGRLRFKVINPNYLLENE